MENTERSLIKRKGREGDRTIPDNKKSNPKIRKTRSDKGVKRAINKKKTNKRVEIISKEVEFKKCLDAFKKPKLNKNWNGILMHAMKVKPSRELLKDIRKVIKKKVKGPLYNMAYPHGEKWIILLTKSKETFDHYGKERYGEEFEMIYQNNETIHDKKNDETVHVHPVMDILSTTDTIPVIDTIPVVDTTPVIDTTPIVEQTPLINVHSMVNIHPLVNVSPVIEQSPVYDTIHVHQTPLVYHDPFIHQTPFYNEIPPVTYITPVNYGMNENGYYYKNDLYPNHNM